MCKKDLIQLTYDDDKLARNKDFGYGLRSLIKNSSRVTNNNSLVIALDSGWGTGKTWFLRMFTNDLNNTSYKAVYYNAWENDDYEHALIPLISEVTKNENNKKDIAEKTGRAIGTALGVLGRQLIRNNIGIDTKEIAEEIENIIASDYEKHISEKKDLKDELGKLSYVNKVIVMVDELDRCKPTFAIETLEVIKHFLDIENYIFIFALDMQQLSYSIATIYGQGMDSPGYLRRFFDIQLRIPSVPINKYLDTIINNNLLEYKGDFSTIFEYFGLSLRDINIIYNYFYIFYNFYKRNIPEDESFIPIVFMFLITTKYKEPETYDLLLKYKFSLSENEKSRLFNIYSSLVISDIRAFLVAFANGRMQNTFNELSSMQNKYEAVNKLLISLPKANETVSHYIDRNLEIIGFNNKDKSD